MASVNCENCAYYDYDEEYECFVCRINLDEDELYRFLQGGSFDCSYFDPYDEYKVVRKQN